MADLIRFTAAGCFKTIKARWGCPEELITDNVPQFTGGRVCTVCTQ